MTPRRLIAIDWGTSSFRAYRLDERGCVTETRGTADGILSVRDGGFEQKLREIIGDWLDPDVPCIASGMITSRQGWIETPYVPCPASQQTLADHLVHHRLADGVHIAFVPGVRVDGGIHDVMRGEETQILGIMRDGLAMHPGTHAKWARVEDGAITHFVSFMTGETFAVLLDHSILGRLAEGRDHDPDSFRRGVQAGARAAATGGFTHEIFGARSLALAGKLPSSGIASYLSGVLIGCEITSAPKLLTADDAAPLVFGARELVDRYCEAFDVLSVAAKRGSDDGTIRGLTAIAGLSTWPSI